MLWARISRDKYLGGKCAVQDLKAAWQQIPSWGSQDWLEGVGHCLHSTWLFVVVLICIFACLLVFVLLSALPSSPGHQIARGTPKLQAPGLNSIAMP